MSDRRTKEREKVWGRRPVILRFDPGHPRQIESKQPPEMSEAAASAMLAALFQSVIQTDGLYTPPPAPEPAAPKPPTWYLVEQNGASAVRTPIELVPDETAMEPQAAEPETAVAVQEPPKPAKKGSFWRLQSPHLSLNIFPPRQN